MSSEDSVRQAVVMVVRTLALVIVRRVLGERDGQLVSYDNRRLDAAREVRAEDPTYRVKIERLDPNAINPVKTTGMSWDKSFEVRMKDPRNRDANGCRVPWQGLFDRPTWKGKG